MTAALGLFWSVVPRRLKWAASQFRALPTEWPSNDPKYPEIVGHLGRSIWQVHHYFGMY
jgi:hypothetical protein